MIENHGNLLVTLSMSNIIVDYVFWKNWNGRVSQIILYAA